MSAPAAPPKMDEQAGLNLSLKKSDTSLTIRGIRVEPPTRTISCTRDLSISLWSGRIFHRVKTLCEASANVACMLIRIQYSRLVQTNPVLIQESIKLYLGYQKRNLKLNTIFSFEINICGQISLHLPVNNGCFSLPGHRQRVVRALVPSYSMSGSFDLPPQIGRAHV